MATATLRHFNRTYTQRIGVLEESFLGLGMPLAAARLLFEIGPAGTTVRELRDRLGLDSGYLSRLLRTLQERELVIVPGASHLFEEPGALEEVARLAADWLTRHLAAPVPGGRR